MDMGKITARLDVLVGAAAIDGALAAHAVRLIERLPADREDVALHFCQSIAAGRIADDERHVLEQVPDMLDLARRAINNLPLGDTMGTHLAHCHQGDYEGTCAYGDPDCPAAGLFVRDPGFGEVQGHCSEDDGVPDVGVAMGLGEGCSLWVGELLARDGADVGVVFHGPGGQRIVAPMTEWPEVADILQHYVAPAMRAGAAAAAVPRTADELSSIIRGWLDADDASHAGTFEKRLDAITNPDGEGNATRAAAALIEWCRRQASNAGHGHIDENQAFVVRALLEEFDRANAVEALGDISGAAALGGETMRFLYRNWRGEIGMREVRTPVVTYFGKSEYHQGGVGRDGLIDDRIWLVRAFDLAKDEFRDFALADMRFLHQLYDGFGS